MRRPNISEFVGPLFLVVAALVFFVVAVVVHSGPLYIVGVIILLLATLWAMALGIL